MSQISAIVDAAMFFAPERCSSRPQVWTRRADLGLWEAEIAWGPNASTMEARIAGRGAEDERVDLRVMHFATEDDAIKALAKLIESLLVEVLKLAQAKTEAMDRQIRALVEPVRVIHTGNEALPPEGAGVGGGA